MRDSENSFSIIETMLYDRGYDNLDFHVMRMQGSAGYFEYPFSEKEFISHLNGLKKEFGNSRYKVRVLLNANGIFSVEYTEIEDDPTAYRITISKEHTDSTSKYLYHKTTHREMYNRILAEAKEKGFWDVIFYNERGEVTEGARTNVYIKKEGKLITPPITCGLLNGTMRQKLLKEREIIERIIPIEEFRDTDEVYVSNALIGLQKAILSPNPE